MIVSTARAQRRALLILALTLLVAGSRFATEAWGAGAFAVGTSVLFINKVLTGVNSPIGPISVSLDSREPSVGSLASAKFPTTHTQSFFLQIDSSTLGTLVADDAVVLSANISSTPPTATYKLSGKAVSFYQKGDAGKKTMLTIQSVESDVTPGE